MHDLWVQFDVLIHVITMSSALGSDMDVHAREVELQRQVVSAILILLLRMLLAIRREQKTHISHLLVFQPRDCYSPRLASTRFAWTCLNLCGWNPGDPKTNLPTLRSGFFPVVADLPRLA